MTTTSDLYSKIKNIYAVQDEGDCWLIGVRNDAICAASTASVEWYRVKKDMTVYDRDSLGTMVKVSPLM